MNIRLCILGKPGSGKGTISKLLMERLPTNINYFNVGSILRDRARQGDLHIKQVHAAGGLVNSDKVLDIIQEALLHENFILDGSPRRPEEAKFVLTHAQWNKAPGLLIHLNISDDTAKQRLISRGRFDDSIEIIENRLLSFNNTTTESITAFGERCVHIDAEQNPNKVVNDILQEMSKYL
jgi:adenylate kinase